MIMNSISVVISAYNEEHHIRRVLESVSWAQEIVVVDNESTDNTAAIAKKMGALVISRPNNLMLNKNKNVGFSQAKGDWILNLDADEEVPDELKTEVIKTIENKPEENGFWISRKNIIFGKWIQHGLWWPDKQLRLFKKEKGKFPCVHVHEYLEVEGKTGELIEPFIHHNYENTSQFFHKLDAIYTESEVQNKMNDGYQLSWHDALRFPISDFVKVYFAQEGYKDGLHGLVLAILQSFYSFIIFVKLWEKVGFPEKHIPEKAIIAEIEKNKQTITYWTTTTKLSQEKNFLKRIILRLRRKYVSTH
jgi:glycosyltransferase involved in cell wall biosynthesis